jgi:tetratricopeptide (TPR) repeat protein
LATAGSQTVTGLPESRTLHRSTFSLVVCFTLLVFTELAGAAPPRKAESPAGLLLEAKGIATSIDNPIERSTALDPIIIAQVALDPPGARETLKKIPRSPKKLQYYTALAAAYAETGNVIETERIYADIVVEDNSSQHGKLAAANALGQVAVAYAIKGNIEEASTTILRVKERVPKEEGLSIVVMATARLVEAQSKHGDIRGALRTALSIIEENPGPFMRIIRDRSGNAQELQHMLTGLDEGAQQYAQWGVMSAHIQQGRPRDAQVTASTIKPGRAKAGALLELATYHLDHGTKPLALTLLQEAESSARATPDAPRRAESLQHISVKTAMAGDATRAISIAKSIEHDAHRRSALLGITKVQAQQGEFPTAFNTAALLKHSSPTKDTTVSDYQTAICDILMEMVRSGKGKEATEIATTFQDVDVRRSRLFSAIATAYADMGKLKEASEALAMAETEAQRSARRKEIRQIADKIRLGSDTADQRRLEELLKIGADIQGGLAAMAKALARKGDLNGAVAMADQVNHVAEKLELLKELGVVHMQAGRKEDSLRWARALPRASEKVFALVGIATAFSQETDKRKAKPVSEKPAPADSAMAKSLTG